MAKNEIAVTKTAVREIIKGSNGELIRLADFEQTAEMLKAVVKKHAKLEISESNFQEGKEARAEIREFRYGLQNILKHNKDFLNKAKKQVEQETEDLVKILEESEIKFDKQIKEIEDKKQIEKEAKEKAEANRIAEISKKLAENRAKLEVLFQIGKSEEQEKAFEVILAVLEVEIASEQFGEFEFEAVELFDEYTLKKEAISKRVGEEKELIEEKKRQEKIRLDQELKAKELEESEKRIKEEKEAHDKKLQEEAQEVFKERTLEMTEFGFVLNGEGDLESFDIPNGIVPGWSSIIIREMSSADFREFKKTIKSKIEKAENDAKEKAENDAKEKIKQDELEAKKKAEEEEKALKQKEKEEKELAKKKADETELVKKSKPIVDKMKKSIKKSMEDAWVDVNEINDDTFSKAFTKFDKGFNNLIIELKESLFQ